MKILFFFDPSGLMDKDFAYTLKKQEIEVHEEGITFAKTQQGHTVEMFSLERITSILESFRPDMVFSFNGSGLDNNGVISSEYEKRGIPFVTWFVDRPRVADIGQKYVKRNSFLFVFDRVYIQTLEEIGFEHVYYLPLATNPDRFSPRDDIAQEDSICFIGDLDYKTIQYLAKNIDSMIAGADDRFYSCIQSAIQKQYDLVGSDTWQIIEQALHEGGVGIEEFPQVLRDMLEGFVEREASLRLRIDSVRAVNEHAPTVVYGDVLWEKAVEAEYRGRVNYLTDEIVEIYNRHTIHVNVSKYQLRNAVNQRLYDIPACGGFLITDERHDLFELFDRDEIVSFSSPAELVDHVKTFMHDAPLRERYANRAREKVLSCHTYSHRIQAMVKKVFG